MEPRLKSLWELLWDYDPNGLVAVGPDMLVRVVNPAFCRMFGIAPEQAIGADAEQLLGDVDDFGEVWRTGQERRAEQEYPARGLYVRKVMFAIPAEQIVACIFVDMTHEWRQKSEIVRLRRETIEKVTEVVNNHMKVAQEIAGLLGETTAETKVSLYRLIEMIERESL